MQRVRELYGVPAQRGGRVDVYYDNGRRLAFSGTITVSNGSHIWIKSSGSGVGPFHPTFGVVYYAKDGSVLKDTRESA